MPINIPRNGKKRLVVIAVVLSIFVLVLSCVLAILLFLRTPQQIVSTFIRDSQKRAVVHSSVFLNSQAEQRFAIVYKIPPKMFKVIRTITDEHTATVDIEWTVIDSSHGYISRTDTVSFVLKKDSGTWKLDSVMNGNTLDFNFLFGQ